ncbi:glycosyltransferase [Lacisediminihabitans profunda]|uniref:Glycosyltransferase n=1 Tax=Lacisediminihabitans profunda TaxID=2594790 RepID=A0A5C8UIS9_9MICO|nr:glycosyltransferase [Lacisediminihabitans profunda]TXN28235.1 glycosyltransferase [Lacisediminihabitans profunda]
MSHPEILVVLPTLGDRLETLRQALDSVNEQRAEVSVTLVVVAPPSAVAARELAASLGAVVVDDPKAGISAAINCGLSVRTTEKYYAWVGDDDLLRPHGLATLSAELDAVEEAVLAFGGCDYIDTEGRTIAVSNAGRLATFLLPWGPDLIPHPGTVVRLDALEAIGGFDPALKFAMDLDAFLKLRKHGRFVWTRASVSAFRWHPDSLTVANRLDSSREAESVKRRHLPSGLRPISGAWHYPIRWASSIAAGRVNARARSIEARALAAQAD